MLQILIKLNGFLIIILCSLPLPLNAMDRIQTLFDFSHPEQLKPWLIVNDGVMGGRSQSQFLAGHNQTAQFTGQISLANNGGFASVRTRPQIYALKAFDGIQIRVKGDGKPYQFRIRTDDRFDGIAFRHIFQTEPERWQTIQLPFKDFEAVFRGRVLSSVEPLQSDQIQQVGFLFSNKETEPFKLEIDFIQVYQND